MAAEKAALVHRLVEKVLVDEETKEPYFATACGLRANAAPTAITDNPADVTCARCRAKKVR